MRTSSKVSEEEYVTPGTVRIAPAALQLARQFDEAIKHARGGNWVVVFDWAVSVTVRRGPNQPLEDVGPCLMLAAAERNQIPTGYTQSVEGVEFAVQIPKEVLQKSIQRLIDVDGSQLFKLALR